MAKSDTQNYDQARYAIDALYERIEELEKEVEEMGEKIQELEKTLDGISFTL